MAKHSLDFRVHNADGVCTGAVHFAEDAAAIVWPEGTIRYRRKIVWREGVDGEAGESYDSCRETIWQRLGWA